MPAGHDSAKGAQLGVHRTKRSFYGCVRCKQLKRKCDEKRPCSRCAAQGQQCVYKELQVIAFDPSQAPQRQSSSPPHARPAATASRRAPLAHDFAAQVLNPSRAALADLARLSTLRTSVRFSDSWHSLLASPRSDYYLPFSESPTTAQMNSYMLQTQLLNAFYGPANLTLDSTTNRWLGTAIGRANYSKALSLSLTAVACGRLAWLAGDPLLRKRGLVLYARAVTSTQAALWRKDTVWDDETLGAIRGLQLFEALESPSQNLRDYFMHIKGMSTYLVEKVKCAGHYRNGSLGNEIVKDYLIRNSMAAFSYNHNLDSIVIGIYRDLLGMGHLGEETPLFDLVLRICNFREAAATADALTDDAPLIEQAWTLKDEIEQWDGSDTIAYADAHDPECCYRKIIVHCLHTYLSHSLALLHLSSDTDASLGAVDRSVPMSLASPAYRFEHISAIGRIMPNIHGETASAVLVASNLLWSLDPWRDLRVIPTAQQFAEFTGLEVAKLMARREQVAPTLPMGMKREYENSGGPGKLGTIDPPADEAP